MRVRWWLHFLGINSISRTNLISWTAGGTDRRPCRRYPSPLSFKSLVSKIPSFLHEQYSEFDKIAQIEICILLKNLKSLISLYWHWYYQNVVNNKKKNFYAVSHLQVTDTIQVGPVKFLHFGMCVCVRVCVHNGSHSYLFCKSFLMSPVPVSVWRSSMVAQTAKNPPAMHETRVWSLGWEDPLEKGMTTHCSILACRIPTDRGAWWATVHGVAKSRTWLSD